MEEKNSALTNKRRKMWESRYAPVSHLCFTKAATGRCTYARDFDIWNDRKLHLDHATCWKDKKTGEVVILNQPYGIGGNSLAEMLERCEEYGLAISISSDYCWWNDYTIGIVIKKKAENERRD